MNAENDRGKGFNKLQMTRMTRIPRGKIFEALPASATIQIAAIDTIAVCTSGAAHDPVAFLLSCFPLLALSFFHSKSSRERIAKRSIKPACERQIVAHTKHMYPALRVRR